MVVLSIDTGYIWRYTTTLLVQIRELNRSVR